MKCVFFIKAFVAVSAIATCALFGRSLYGPTVVEYASVQQALDKNPGRMVFLPPGEYLISAALQIRTPNTGLWGPGRIIQTNPNTEIINIEGTKGTDLRDLTLSRAEGKMETHRPGVRIVRSENVTLSNVQLLDNWGDIASIFAAYCSGLQIKDCLIQNYSRVSVDDRTTIPFAGFAFNCINGAGVLVRHSTGVRIQNNRVIELRMLPTPELKAKHRLGSFIKKNAKKGWQTSQELWDSEYFNGWHQGSAIMVTKGETTDYVQILGNYVENAAQGIDIHGDHVIMAHNIINNAFIGMKAMHGSRNVSIIGNQFSRNDLWSIALLPGTASHFALAVDDASKSDPADPEALTWPITRPGANVDGYSIIAHNIISDFGYGTAHWMWKPESGSPAPIQFNVGPATDKTPPLADVLIQGNVIYDTGRDKILVHGKPQLEPPRYQYAVKIGTGKGAAQGLRFSNNIFHPGTKGVSNVEFSP